MKLNITTSLAVALWLAAVGQGLAQPVTARDFHAFWLWSGVKPSSALDQADEVFLLAGEVKASGIASQRGSVPHLQTPKVWIVYRVQTLDWRPGMLDNILQHVVAWRAGGTHVIGLQIDFDSGTQGLGRYAAFLKNLRGRLPSDLKLGVTGLLDWAAHGDLSGLQGVADEVILQTYQGRHVISGYQAYLTRLAGMGVPFRIGLLESGDWQAPPGLEANPLFKGYVVFLVNGAG